MEFTKKQSSMLKAIAILFMVGLHLYNRTELEGYYQPLLYIGKNPFIYCISFLFDACVPLFLFSAGYAAYINKNDTFKQILQRILKLMINFWIVIILTILLGLIFKNPNIPGSFNDLLGNLFLYDINYVGAWWFMQTYVILTLSSSLIIKWIDKMNGILVTIISIVIYLTAYYFRMMNPIVTNIYVLNLLINASVLLGTSLLSYVFGILFRKYKIVSQIRTIFKFEHSNVIAFGIILLCILGHWIIKSLIVSPFVSIVFVIAYALLNFKGIWEKILLFFASHSTNIWLLHMQFYMIFMKDFVFSTNTVIGCLIIVLTLSIIGSYIVKYIFSMIVKKCKFSII